MVMENTSHWCEQENGALQPNIKRRSLLYMTKQKTLPSRVRVRIQKELRQKFSWENTRPKTSWHTTGVQTQKSTLNKAEECRLEHRKEQGKYQENLKFKEACNPGGR